MSEVVLSRRDFLRVTLATAGLTTLAGVSVSAYATLIEPYHLEVRYLELALPSLHPAFQGYRIAQFSDIHMGAWMTVGILEPIIETLNVQDADLIALTGDFVTVELGTALAADYVALLRQLSARDGALAVLGNHDHWTNDRAVRGFIERAGMIDVNNDVYSLKRGAAQLHVAGVDDYWEGKADLERVLTLLPGEGAAVLLAHEPDYADISAASRRFDLQLSGHSHGGQISLPFFGPPILPTFGKKYPAGLYLVGQMLQYTNRGVGMIAPYVRFNCRPEITVFTLVTAADATG